jgi:hypothetical protein
MRYKGKACEIVGEKEVFVQRFSTGQRYQWKEQELSLVQMIAFPCVSS